MVVINMEISSCRNWRYKKSIFYSEQLKNVKAVYNFAAQVAVTTSLVDPIQILKLMSGNY